jgi:hypothetical protein
MEESRPVFIVGMARSGTSMIYRTLQHHSSFRLAQRLSGFELTESSVFTQSSSAFQFMLSDEPRYLEFLKSVKSIPPSLAILSMNRHIRRFASLSRRTRVYWWKLCLNHHLIRSFFYFAGQARGVTRLVEKSPVHGRFLPEIMATFPQAKGIFICRHPVDAYSSYRRRLQAVQALDTTSKPSVNWLSLEPEQFCKLWRTDAEIALRASYSNPDNILLVRYEDFTSEPEQFFRRVCSFIDEPYEADCIRQDAPSLSSWKQDPLLAKPITKNTKLWSDLISKATASFIETQLADIMKQLGYFNYTVAHH